MSELREDNRFTSEDIRFTTRDNKLYAIALDWPDNGKLDIKTLRAGTKTGDLEIKGISLLGSDEELQWSRSEQALVVQLPMERSGEYAHVLAITL